MSQSSQALTMTACLTCSLAAMLGIVVVTGAANFTEGAVNEIDSLVFVQETVNVQKIHQHLQLWAKEAEGSSDKLAKLLAARAMREADKRLHTLQGYVGNITLPTVYFGNQHNRMKRNILGDLIHQITGLATDDELNKQMKIDEEIRDKITSTLTRQVTFEKTLATIYGNLSREEEATERKLQDLTQQRRIDKQQLIRLHTLSKIAQDDLDELEDVIDGIRQGRLNTRHSLKISHKIGARDGTIYQIDQINTTKEGIVIVLKTRLMIKTMAKIREERNYQSWTTMLRIYLVHPSRTQDYPLIESEVRTRNGDCASCALLVHLGALRYKAVKEGMLECDSRDIQLKEGEMIQLGTNMQCSNDLIDIGNKGLNIRHLRIDLTSEVQVDSIILNKMVKESGVTLHQMNSHAQQHVEANLQLQHDLNAAEQEVKNFIQETKTDMSVNYMQDYATWGMLAVITITVVSIVLCILSRMCKCDTTQGNGAV
jgi:hypothetical protein